jgi:hypothetical protein
LSLSVCLFACGADRPAEPAAGEAPGTAAAAEPGALGSGFVVWESNRTGDWRIWTRDLAGGAPRQLTPDEPGRQHCCALIAHDGRRLVYLSRTNGRDQYPVREIPGELRLVELPGGRARTVSDSARSYGWGDRAAVWRDESTLIHVGGDGRTMLLDLGTGRSRPLTDAPREQLGWLLDPTMTHATNAAPSFDVYHPASRTVLMRQPLGGCEPYFTQDGRWGFWVAKGGGPIKKMRLADRRVSTLIERRDPRLPPDLGYVYFPITSRDGRALAWGASSGDHDHFGSDYEIFVAPADPYRLELAGPPRRITDHPATDRYPDVWVEPLPLGVHGGEVPLEVRFALPGGAGRGERSWDYGDGTTERAVEGRHTYRRPGSYAVRATAGGETLAGQVTVVAPEPPRVVEAALDPGGRRIEVRFDRPVALGGARAALESGVEVAGRRAAADGRALTLELAEPVPPGDRLRLSGVEGREPAGELPTAWVRVEPPPWPSDRGGLVFVWQAADRPNLVYDPAVGMERTFPVEQRGEARINRFGAMVTGGGRFEAPPTAGEALAAAVRESSELTLEARLTPLERGAARSGTAVAFGDGAAGALLRLDQQGDRLELRLATGGGAPEPVPLFEVVFDRPVALAAVFDRGRLAVYRDGRRVVERDLGGDLAGWRPGPLVFGDRPGGGGGWAGRLEGVALYGRALGAQEVAENVERYRRVREAHAGRIEPVRVRAVLTARSEIPTLREISPYRQALAVFDYRVEGVIDGRTDARRVRVAHWVILDGETLPIARAEPGREAVLDLEPFAANPQLESHYLSDTLPPAPGAELYFAVEVGR